jgi:hypothetical protein
VIVLAWPFSAFFSQGWLNVSPDALLARFGGFRPRKSVTAPTPAARITSTHYCHPSDGSALRNRPFEEGGAGAMPASPPASKHSGVHAVGRIVPVEEGADVDDHLLAHVETAFEGCRAEMR